MNVSGMLYWLGFRVMQQDLDDAYQRNDTLSEELRTANENLEFERAEHIRSETRMRQRMAELFDSMKLLEAKHVVQVDKNKQLVDQCANERVEREAADKKALIEEINVLKNTLAAMHLDKRRDN